jgi:hypothetical protein
MIILERGEQLQAHHVAGDLDRVGLVIVARLARLELVEAPATTDIAAYLALADRH